MFKGRAGNHIHLGLSRENIRRLKADDPIVFNLSELGLGSRGICISCQKKGFAAFPKGFDGVGIALSVRLLDGIDKKPHHLILDGGIEVMIFSGDTEQSIERQLKSLIGPETLITRKGFPPGSFTEDN